MKEVAKFRYSLIPNIEYHRNRAKALLRDLQAGELYALWEYQQFHPDAPPEAVNTQRTFLLADAQLIIARSNGYASWAQFKSGVESKGPVPSDLKFIGFISDKLTETKEFYLRFFNYTIRTEESDALILASPQGTRTLGFIRPSEQHPHSITHHLFKGQGVYLTFSSEDVMRDLAVFQKHQVPIETGPIVSAGETQFMVRDPNGIGIYVSEPRLS